MQTFAKIHAIICLFHIALGTAATQDNNNTVAIDTPNNSSIQVPPCKLCSSIYNNCMTVSYPSAPKLPSRN
ncbi:hypothetical protein J1614_009400 [Plenodomus biglobosus]|nr:hypothetical protein J1614_009400 [Plenodomus biglobosus]